MSASNIVVWRTTNSLCQKTMIENEPDMKGVFAKWKDEGLRAQLERECHQNCPLLGKVASCHDWTKSEHTTARFYRESLDAIGDVQHTGNGTAATAYVLDAYGRSKA